MSLDKLIQNRRLHQREETLINHCSSCTKELTDQDVYIISKAYDKGRCVLEVAHCLVCQSQLRFYLSEQSMTNIQLYRGRRFEAFMTDPLARRAYYLQDPSCAITGEEIDANASFELHTLNGGPFNQDEEDYFFVGETALEQMTELLSEETKRNYQNFLDQLDPTSPEVIVPSLFG